MMKSPGASSQSFLATLANHLSKVLFFVLVVLVWQGIVDFVHPPLYILPSVYSVALALSGNLVFLFQNLWVTTSEALLGFSLGVVVALGLSLVAVLSRYFRAAIMPGVIISNSFPVIAIAPLIVLWFGLGLGSKIIIAALLAFFPITINLVSGMELIDRELLDLAHVLSANRVQVVFKFRFPYALPSFFSGMKVAMPLAIIGAVIGEFVGAQKGLGYQIILAEGQLSTPLLFSCLIFLAAISIVLYYIMVGLEKALIRWKSP